MTRSKKPTTNPAITFGAMCLKYQEKLILSIRINSTPAMLPVSNKVPPIVVVYDSIGQIYPSVVIR